MSHPPPPPPSLNLVSRQKRYSFAFMLGLLAVSAWLNLGILFLTALFSFLLLRLLTFHGSKLPAVVLFCLVLALIVWALVHFSTRATVTLPGVAENTIPKLVSFAQQNGRELPFTDWDSLRERAMDAVLQQKLYLTNAAAFAQSAARLAVQFIVGCVVAVSVYLNNRINLEDDEPDSLYGLCSQEISARFRTFFGSFSTVMGAQLVISAINTAVTGAFIALLHLPHHFVLIGVTFICGLLPVVGNLISNTLITAVAFTLSPSLAGWALLFLIGLHKLEYFLNSKIIGDRIRNPLWLTLLGLVVGERVMGLPGMILAPVFLHYLKVEASKIRLPAPLAGEQ